MSNSKFYEELPRSLHVADIAAFLGISKQTVRAECNAQRIPAKRVGRQWVLSRDAFIRWLDGDADANRG